MPKSQEEQIIEDLRQATREARECLKDFKTLIKEYNSLVDSWEQKIETRISDHVKEGLNRYSKVLGRAIEDASNAINKRFDYMYDLLTTGGNHTEPSIPEMLESRVRNPELVEKLKKHHGL